DYVVALEVTGRSLTTEELSAWLSLRLREARPLAMLIGGPDGLAPECRQRADQSWSLSPLTLPHALVRGVVAEQIYRAMSILAGPPISPRLKRRKIGILKGMRPDFVYLASASPRRRQLLEQIGVAFQVLNVEIDESAGAREVPLAYVTRLAAAKAGAGLRQSEARGSFA